MAENKKKSPTIIIILGMAGSGKTTFVQRLTSFLHSQKTPPYVINLDPACLEVPYPCNIDIRDTVNYKEVMKQYGLGPNGGIVTSLNLFATKFDQVLHLISSKKGLHDFVILDTPGQIEVFTWSASGQIITEACAAGFSTLIVYVADTVKSRNPVTFMSNMLYAVSILYKTKLPLIVAMNKIDILSNDYALNWMSDFEAFQDSLQHEKSYSANLAQSLSLALDEFYSTMTTIGVSALTGQGFDDLLKAVSKCENEYETEYRVEYERLLRNRNIVTEKEQKKQLEELKKDRRLDLVSSQRVESEETSGIMIRASRDSFETDEREETRDEEDEEERKEYESFKSYIDSTKDT